jgi:hypothetical protein
MVSDHLHQVQYRMMEEQVSPAVGLLPDRNLKFFSFVYFFDFATKVELTFYLNVIGWLAYFLVRDGPRGFIASRLIRP